MCNLGNGKVDSIIAYLEKGKAIDSKIFITKKGTSVGVDAGDLTLSIMKTQWFKPMVKPKQESEFQIPKMTSNINVSLAPGTSLYAKLQPNRVSDLENLELENIEEEKSQNGKNLFSFHEENFDLPSSQLNLIEQKLSKKAKSSDIDMPN